jgi:hypothetical protein
MGFGGRHNRISHCTLTTSTVFQGILHSGVKVHEINMSSGVEMV